MIELAAFLGNPGPGYARNRHNAGRLLAERLPFYGEPGWQKKYKGLYAALEGGRILSAASVLPDTAAAPSSASSAAAPEAAGSPAPAVPPVPSAGTAPPPADPASPAVSTPPRAVPALPGKLHFLLPETFMNLSGESVQAAAAFFKIPPERILVVHDELELPLGTVSLKFSGGLGGHNGLRSLKASLGTADFWRLRIGIGRPGDRVPGQGGPPGSGKGIIDWVLSDFSAAEEALLGPALAAAAAVLVRALAYGPETLLPEWGKKRVTQDV
ncbi:MAG: aminoacyl-tRNA hydrolase [Treponema sp.]|jgi:PTH1 family peptidyl-tRNA hydrolase|nr:aminoacyl-tRNA hydrolase [Treponema sp.]